MAKVKQQDKQVKIKVVKRTSQGGRRPKLGTMNKGKKRSYKSYRGQG